MPTPVVSINQVPIKDPMSDDAGLVARTWEVFFRYILQSLTPLGVETSFQLLNNQTTAQNITGLAFNSKSISFANVEFLIQRITTGTGATELITSGIFHAVFKPIANTWVLTVIGTPGPSTSGITLSITASGQVQYTSTNITGTASISRLVYRARTIAAKSRLYST